MEALTLDAQIALLSVFAQVALTFHAVITMAIVRVREIKANDIRLADISVDSSRYPAIARQYANNLANQFEFPVLLYVAVVLSLVLEASFLMFALACTAYVATRFVHRFIHVTSNQVVRRFQVFLAGMVFLGSAWVILLLGLLSVL